jgi:hypothetical protein
MKKLLLLGSTLLVIAGCSSVNDGKSLTQEVTAQPSPAFMKKVAGDPFPAAGAQVGKPGSASKPAGQVSSRVGAGSVTSQSGTVQLGPATPAGTAKKSVSAIR